MTASILFLAGEGSISIPSGYGLGFYHQSFQGAVRVGEWNTKTFITNSDGSYQGPEIDNVQYLNEGSGILGSAGSGLALTAIPNYQATLNTRVVSDVPIRVNSGRLFFYDGSDTGNLPAETTIKAAEVIHPDLVQVNNGSGQSVWTNAGGGVNVSMANSPGAFGLYAGDGNSTRFDTQHDWYHLITLSPDMLGSKQLAIFCELDIYEEGELTEVSTSKQLVWNTLQTVEVSNQILWNSESYIVENAIQDELGDDILDESENALLEE